MHDIVSKDTKLISIDIKNAQIIIKSRAQDTLLGNHFSNDDMTFKFMQWHLTSKYLYAQNDPVYWKIITKYKDSFSGLQ